MLFYYSITAPANTNVLIVSVLLIIAGGLMIGVGICQIVTTAKIIKDNHDITKHDRCKYLYCVECVRYNG